MAFEWTGFASMTTLVLAVVGLLATALFQLGSKMDRLSERVDRLSDRVDQRFERVDQRFERVDHRFDVVELRMREDKAELLGRMDVLAERLTRLEAS